MELFLGKEGLPGGNWYIGTLVNKWNEMKVWLAFAFV